MIKHCCRSCTDFTLTMIIKASNYARLYNYNYNYDCDCSFVATVPVTETGLTIVAVGVILV